MLFYSGNNNHTNYSIVIKNRKNKNENDNITAQITLIYQSDRQLDIILTNKYRAGISISWSV